jgi:mannose/cellobiose epimerase-like protein (N-acyl-D-glucosamine 2-epimerase family)
VKEVNAQKFFRVEVSSSWGYLVKEKKTLTKQEETIREARVVYREGIRKAWDIYTQDNVIVKEAKKVLDSKIDEA